MKDSKQDTNRKSSSLFEIFEKADNFLSAFFADFCGADRRERPAKIRFRMTEVFLIKKYYTFGYV